MPTDPIEELHQSLILDHFRSPRNRGPQDPPATRGRAHNPFCGDTVVVWVRTDEDTLDRVSFDGKGCSISQAAGSMLTVIAKGRTIEEIRAMREEFVAALTPDPVSLGREFGDLRALVGVGRFPSRIRCALLAFDALEQALAEENTDGEEG